ncbi:uncharacterized protein METZ01_LOCUS470273, partial [marine metagenome]
SPGCDECDVCGGDTSTCQDCAGTPNGTATLDICGVCNGTEQPNTGICDCEGVPNGNKISDECGVCEGDGYNANCTDLDYLLQAYTDTGTCVNMDCSGVCTSAGGGSGAQTMNYYLLDADGDGWGTQAAGYHCSGEVNTIEDTGTDVDSGSGYYVSQAPDIDEDCYCQANTYADCYDCLGNCRYLSNGTESPDYIGGTLTGIGCVEGNLSSSPGCDACGVCDGSGVPTWYADSDGDGLGNSSSTTDS